MEILKKLKLLINLKNIFKYKFVIPENLFFKLKIKTYYITKANEFIICYGLNSLYKILKEYEDIEIINQYHNFFKKILLKKLLIIITFILVSLTFLFSGSFIREVVFKNEEYYDKRVYDYVMLHLENNYGLYSLNTSITDISRNLRCTFPNYAYIGLSKKGSKLIIDIEKMNIELPNNNNNILVKSIRSKYNAVIHGISCKEGVVLVNLNQFVKKGEELVVRKDDESTCNAVIVGNVLEKEIIVVRKNKISFGYTGNMECKYNLKVGKNYLFKLNEFYSEQTIKIENLVNIFNIIVIVKEIAYEQDYCLINYDYDSAYRYAESMLYYKLELERKSPLEKINDIKLLSYSEDDDKYYFEFIVNQVKSIGFYS